MLSTQCVHEKCLHRIKNIVSHRRCISLKLTIIIIPAYLEIGDTNLKGTL